MRIVIDIFNNELTAATVQGNASESWPLESASAPAPSIDAGAAPLAALAHLQVSGQDPLALARLSTVINMGVQDAGQAPLEGMQSSSNLPVESLLSSDLRSREGLDAGPAPQAVNGQTDQE